MCYDIKVSLHAQLIRARRKGDVLAIEEIKERLAPHTDLPIYHCSGFNHPELLIYTDKDLDFPEVATWGLIPHWVRDEEQQKKIWNNTLNARGETIFEKSSFRDAAKHNKCIIYVDGFYEHHHYKGKTYPFYIYRKDGKPMALAGLYSDWKNQLGGAITSFTIVTTKGNNTLTKIHNNPKLKEPRMPLILSEELEDPWLKSTAIDETNALITSFSDSKLSFHTVARLRGKEYKGNVEEISDKIIYEELEF